MSTIVTRAGKGSALTHNEVDANFNNLNTDKLQSGNTAAALTITTATFGAGTVSAPAITTSGDTNTGIFFPAADTIAFTEGGVESMRIDSSGNLGLGVTPSAWSTSFGQKAIQFGPIGSLMSLQASTTNNQTFISSNAVNLAGGWTYMYSDYATQYRQYLGTHAWFNSASGTAGNVITFTQAMTLDASGNLALGVTSVTGWGSRLLAKAATNSIFGGIAVTANSVDSGVFIGHDATVGAIGTSYGSTGAYTPLTFLTGGSERARITSGGNLLVGATATVNSELLGATKNGNVFLVKNTQNTGTARLVYQNGAGTIDYFYNYASSSEIGSITNTTTSVAYNTTSDYRLKDNQQPLTGSGAFIDALQPKTWNWKTDGSKGVGFIAHEVQAVSFGSVVGTKDAVDEEGKPVMQAMEYGSAEFIANIIAELQSLRARVAQLEGN